MSKINLKALKAAAEKASPIPSTFHIIEHYNKITGDRVTYFSDEYAEYISITDPKTVKALIECIEKMRRAAENTVGMFGPGWQETSSGCFLKEALSFVDERIEL